MTERVRRLIEYHFAEHNSVEMSERTIERVVKALADRAGISKQVSPHVYGTLFQSTVLRREYPRERFRPFWATID